MLLATVSSISSTAATLFGVIIGLLVTVLGFTWRIGNKIGEIKTEIKNHSDDISELQKRQYNHDQWHLKRGDR